MNNSEEIALAESFGITAVPDDKRGKGWCKFHIGDTHIWAIREGWQVADLIGGMYCNHNIARLRDNGNDYDKALEAAFIDAVNRQDQDVLVNKVADIVGRLADRVCDLYAEDNDFFSTKMDDAQETVIEKARELLACDDGLTMEVDHLTRKLGLDLELSPSNIELSEQLWHLLVSEVVKRFGLWLISLEGHGSASGRARSIIKDHFESML